VAIESKTITEFAPPRWLFSWHDNGDSMPGYSRHDFDCGQGERAALFSHIGDQEPQIARLDHLTAVFDGVLYEPGRLAQELGVGEEPENRALLLLQCYRVQRDSFLKRLRGTFALVLWNAETGELLCVRDPMGYYPCFFAQPGRQVLISTSVQVLLDHPSVSRSVNRLVLLDYFFDIWARREETFYSSVKRVSPGHVLRVRDGEPTLSRYWNPLPTGNGGGFIEAGGLGRFEELLARSVNRCLEQGPVGIFLSGGLDSVSVAALARRGSEGAGLEPPRALSLAFPTAEYNEEAVQTSVARQLGLPLEMVRLEDAAGAEGLFGAIEELSREFASPIQNIWMPAYSHLTLLAKAHGIRTILTGMGGDEWLGVSPFAAADFIRAFRFGELRSIWSSIGRTVPVSRSRFAYNLIWVFGLRPLLREETVNLLGRTTPGMLRSVVRGRRARRKKEWLEVEPELWSEFLRRLEVCETDFKPLDGPYGYYFGDILRGADHPIISMEMEENFQNARRLGVRLLHPYIDADLVEMLCAVPPTMLTVGGANKGLAREFLGRQFPDLGFEKQTKIVVRRALPQNVLGDAERLWKENGKAKALPAIGLADAGRLNAYLTKALKSESHHDTFRAWQIVATEQWLRTQQ
jgi:asparagine synthetase B (glutamine-hydrolysing)